MLLDEQPSNVCAETPWADPESNDDAELLLLLDYC